MHDFIPQISFCIGVYNEEEILLESIKKIKKNLDEIVGLNRYEIILVDNGSTDKTASILEDLNDKNIRSFFISKKGHGLAFQKAIINAKYEYIVLNAIDIPFGFEDLKKALEYWSSYDIIYGSKAHPKSIINKSFKRQIASYVYRLLLKVLLNIQIKDTQGTIFFKKDKVLKILKYCDAENAFFCTQLAIYANLHNFGMIEIPVKMGKEIRISKYKVFRDGFKMMRSIIREYIKLKKLAFKKPKEFNLRKGKDIKV